MPGGRNDDRERNPRANFEGRPATRPEPRKGNFEKSAAELGQETAAGQPSGTPPARAGAPPERPAVRGGDFRRPNGLRNAPDSTTVAEGRSLEQARNRTFAVDATLDRYFGLSFPDRKDGQTFSPYVAFVRQFEMALINEVAEKHGLLSERVGAGADQSRAFLAVHSSLDLFSKGPEDMEKVLGKSLSLFTQHFHRALEGQRRELTSQSMNWNAQAQVAAQLKVQSGPIRIVDPETQAVPPAHAVRVPLGNGETATYGFTWTGKARQRQLQLVDESTNVGGLTFAPMNPKNPQDLGLPELQGANGALRAETVKALEARGVVFVTHAATERDLLAGTVLDSQDGGRVILANLLTETFQAVLEDQGMEQVLASEPQAGTAEILRRADQFIGATIVTLGRLDRSTLDDVNRAKDGSAVDPVAQVVESLRASLQPLARQEKLAELAETVKGNIKQLSEGLPSFVQKSNPDYYRNKMLKDLAREISWIDSKGGDIFESIEKVTSLSMQNADERASREGAAFNFGSDLALILNRSGALNKAIADVRAVMDKVGLDQKTLAAYSSDAIFASKFDTILGTQPDSVLGRQYLRTWKSMEILTHGKVKVGDAGAGEVDPYAHENPLFSLANKVMAENQGIIQRHQRVAAAEGMLADAYLVEIAGPYLDSMNEGKGATPAELQGLQRVARIALEDHIKKAPQPGNLEPEWVAWYAPLRRKMEEHWGQITATAKSRDRERGGGIPSNDAELQAAIGSLAQPRAKILMQRGVTFMGLLGAHYGAMRAETRAPGHPIRLMKVNAAIKIAQGVASRMPDVPHYASNYNSIVRIFQVKDEQGRPSGKYGQVIGKPSWTGKMNWEVGRLIDKPKSGIPTEVYQSGIQKRRVEIVHASLKLPVPMDTLGEKMDQDDLRQILGTISDHFSDVPLANGGYLSHGLLDGGEALAKLGIYLPSGAIRPMNFEPGRGYLINGDRTGKPQAELDLFPLDPRTGDFARKRNGEMEDYKRTPFTSVEELTTEMDRRVAAAAKSLPPDSEEIEDLKRVAAAVVSHCADIMNPKIRDQALLAMMTGATGAKTPCALLVTPIKSNKRWGAASDPEACTRAYARFSQTMAAVGSAFEGFETRP